VCDKVQVIGMKVTNENSIDEEIKAHTFTAVIVAM
jgi:hypothetical protein